MMDSDLYTAKHKQQYEDIKRMVKIAYTNVLSGMLEVCLLS